MAKPQTKLEGEIAAIEVKTGGIAVVDDSMFLADAGIGMEGATQESFAIPFLSVLQKGSPQADEALPTFIEGAKAGMFFENVTGRMFDGKKGVTIVPCAYRRVFIHWGGREGVNPGFKGELTPEDVAQLRADGKVVELDGRLYFPEKDGSIHEKKSDRVSDTRNHYVLLIDEETGAWANALISLTSTQIKKSKMLMSALASVKISGPAGMVTPPTFANFVRATTLGESNDKGAWHGIKFELAGKVNRAEVYAAAKAFHATVIRGGVEVKYESPVESEENGKGF